MQVPASDIAPLIESARKIPAVTIPMPMITRISAYSAAEAPDSSRRNEIRKFFMSIYPNAPAGSLTAVVDPGSGVYFRLAPSARERL